MTIPTAPCIPSRNLNSKLQAMLAAGADVNLAPQAFYIRSKLAEGSRSLVGDPVILYLLACVTPAMPMGLGWRRIEDS